MEFTGKYAKELATIAVQTLNEKFAELGYDVTVTNGGGKYEPQEFAMKLLVATTSEDGETKAQVDYKQYAKLYDLPLEMLGASVKFNGKVFTVTGFLPNRPKRNIQIEDTKGHTFIAPHTQVIRAYNSQQKRDLGNLMPQEVA